jgi:hypothetical protein
MDWFPRYQSRRIGMGCAPIVLHQATHGQSIPDPKALKIAAIVIASRIGTIDGSRNENGKFLDTPVIRSNIASIGNTE